MHRGAATLGRRALRRGPGRGPTRGGANGRRALDALRAAPGSLSFQFSRSSGPGGQNVNKVNTRAELRLDLDRAARAAALPRDVADRLAATTRATAARVVVVSAQTSRTQKGNRDACEAKLVGLLDDAWDPPQVRTQRVGISGTTKRARAADKRRRGDLKASRGHVRDW
jgi:ribosome-associated protein